MQRFLTIILFYKPFVWWSLAINLVLGIFNFHLVFAAITKLFLLIFLWYYVHETQHRRRFLFFKNLGISSRRLFVTVFIVDLLLTLSFLALFKEFN
jgi:hypothetical protein